VLFLSLFFATSIPRGSINRCILLYYILIHRYIRAFSFGTRVFPVQVVHRILLLYSVLLQSPGLLQYISHYTILHAIGVTESQATCVEPLQTAIFNAHPSPPISFYFSAPPCWNSSIGKKNIKGPVMMGNDDGSWVFYTYPHSVRLKKRSRLCAGASWQSYTAGVCR